MALSRGTQLGSYEILDPIGSGGMGEVYRGRDARLGRDVAIKTLPDGLTHNPERLAFDHFQDEILRSARFQQFMDDRDVRMVQRAHIVLLENWAAGKRGNLGQ